MWATGVFRQHLLKEGYPLFVFFALPLNVFHDVLSFWIIPPERKLIDRRVCNARRNQAVAIDLFGGLLR
jgi:hypothetical protein